MADFPSPSVADASSGDPSLPAARPRGRDQAQQRREEVWRLGVAGDPWAYVGLANALRDPDVEVRREAVWALARLGEVKGLPLLDRAICDPDPEVREMAREVLMNLHRKDAAAR